MHTDGQEIQLPSMAPKSVLKSRAFFVSEALADQRSDRRSG